MRCRRCRIGSAAIATSQQRNSRVRPAKLSGTMRKHQLKLADRQLRMSELSARIQWMDRHAVHGPLRRATE